MAFKAWKYEGYEFDDDISAYFKIGEGGCPAYSMKWMAYNMQHLRLKGK